MAEILVFAATFLTAVAMSLSLAHALELPGKLRLDRDHYLAVQTIYYPGFTYGGFAEPLAIAALAALLVVQPAASTVFWLTAGALAAMAATQILFWTVVQPVNRQWLASTELSEAAERFFRSGPSVEQSADWTRLRDRWERGHFARAVTSTAAFVLLLAALGARQA